jgi:hypothetical protein
MVLGTWTCSYTYKLFLNVIHKLAYVHCLIISDMLICVYHFTFIYGLSYMPTPLYRIIYAHRLIYFLYAYMFSCFYDYECLACIRFHAFSHIWFYQYFLIILSLPLYSQTHGAGAHTRYIFLSHSIYLHTLLLDVFFGNSLLTLG